MLPAKKVERAETASSKFNLYMYLCKSMKYVCCEKNERGWGGVGWGGPHLMLRSLGGGGVHAHI